MKAMLVKELIELLKTFDQDLPIAYQLMSEQCLMEPTDISIAELCNARPDGWIQNRRPDMPTTKYLLFPGH